MRHYRRFSALLAVLVVFSFAFVIGVKATSFVVTADPNTLSTEGFVDLKLSVTNTSTDTMENIRVQVYGSDTTYNADPGTSAVPAGETMEVIVSDVYISAEQIGTDIPLVVIWDEDGSIKQTYTSVIIHLGTTEEPIEVSEMLIFSYKVDRTSVKKGDIVVFTFDISNVSQYNVDSITITDTELSSNALFTGLSLDAGKSMQKKYEYVMGNEPVIASPMLTYNSPFGTRTLILNETKIDIVTAEIDFSVSSATPTAEGTLFTITLVNNGNKRVTDVKVYDERDKVVKSGFKIEAGDVYEIEYNVDPDEDRTVGFRLTAKLANGETYECSWEETQRVYPYLDPTLINLEFGVEMTDSPDEDGYASICFTVTNAGSIPMTGLDITTDADSSLSWAMLDAGQEIIAGETITKTYSVYVGETKNMKFNLAAADSVGKPWTYSTIITINDFPMIDDGPAPTQSGSNAFNVGGTLSTLLVDVLKVLGIITAIFAFILIVLSVLEFIQSKKLKRLAIENRASRSSSGMQKRPTRVNTPTRKKNNE